MAVTCTSCKHEVEEWNKKCGTCGFHLVLEPDTARKARYLRTPSLGALLFTQGWTMGARLYFWFLISLVPILGLIALIATVIFGRRWSWKYGGWKDWTTFQQRMRLLDIIGLVWIILLISLYVYTRLTI